MRKNAHTWVVALLVLAAALPGGVAGAASPQARTADAQYVAGGVAGAPPGDNTAIMVQHVVGGVTLPGDVERFVTVTIVDRSGQPVLAGIAQGGNFTKFCGSTAKPVRIQPYTDVDIYLLNGDCGNSKSVVTTGTVNATFGMRP